ncbi:MAG: hypothetical protein LQ340_006928 [Diploschistes diacapsis]|nr:MAG: hypothetical protein LQ340_006928 [Diploschistes diacapsis]
MAPLNIIIVGAGMGGLAAAVGLARNGHKVTVYERSRSCGGVGYSFTITPNSQKCLRYLDIDLEAGGACPVDGWFLHDSEGNVITEMKENQADQRKKGTLSVFAYRVRDKRQIDGQ